MEKERSEFDELREIVNTLRSENGCPWDKEQTHQTLREFLIEECYEVIDAVNKKSDEQLCEELGDVMLQVMMHSQLAEERGAFCIDDVMKGVSQKMVLRHPHVFGDAYIKNAEGVKDVWEEIKKKEKGYATDMDVILSIPESLPALLRAFKTQKKFKKFEVSQHYNKPAQKCISELASTLRELEGILTNSSKNYDNNGKEQLYRKLLYDIVNLGCELSINPEVSLIDEIDKRIASLKENSNL